MTSLTPTQLKAGEKTPEKKSSGKNSKNCSEEQSEMELLLKQLPVLNEYFQLHNKIGKGTFSTVYLATLRNSNSTQKYAVKHLTQHCEQSRIKYELKCLQDIGGKDNVVRAELWLTNGNDCVTFIMPYLPHLKFSDYVIDMDVDETRLYMKNLFIALKRVHSFNIIHRDVKPDNFLYNRETKQFLLVDFGLAQVVRIPNKEVNKVKSLLNENLPLDYSKKRKRAPDSSEDENKPFVKMEKRMALKLKDNNIKVSSPKPYTEIKENEKTLCGLSNQLKSPVKWRGTLEADKTPLKSRSFHTPSNPSSSRRKLLDLIETNSRQQDSIQNTPEKNEPNEGGDKDTRDGSFTPLVSIKSPNGNFVQIKNSRVVRQQALSSTSGIFSKQSPSDSFSLSCPCSGKGAVCSVCKSRNPMCAPRAGTSGFRPPEVLFKYLHQTTAVDIWASGVIMLCILSGCYPFFKSSSDLVSLAEIITIFGSELTAKVAAKFGRRIVCSQNSKGVDLKKLCTRLRARLSKSSRTSKTSQNEPECRDCFQVIRKDGCLCPSDDTSTEKDSDFPSQFPDSAYDLLYRLMDLDPSTRITAAEALEHPFILDL